MKTSRLFPSLVGVALSVALVASASSQTPPAPHVLLPMGTPATAAGTAGAHSAIPAGDLKPIVSGDDSAYFVQQAHLERQLNLLKLQAQISELQKKITANDDAGQSISAPMAIAPPPMASSSIHVGQTTPISSLTLPDDAPKPLRVVSVIGVGGRYQAEIMDHGAGRSVSPGAAISDGWVVGRISANTVELHKGSQAKTLRLGD